MLGKLLKYEFKATGRTFLPLYGAILLVTLIQRLFGRSNQELFVELNRLGDFTTIALVALFMALGVITLLMTIQRFQKNLLTDEGYLMFTLPVSTRNIIISKLIVAITWVILSGIVGIITFCILFIYPGFWGELMMLLKELPEVLSSIEISVQGSIIFMMIQLMVAGLLTYIQFVITIYLSLAIGQFPKFQKHRTAASFITFFLINIVMGWIGGMIGFQLTPEQLFNLNPNMIFFVANVITLVITVILFEATNYILNRHLNLE